MQTLRSLRRSRALTYLDLAALTNIPARTLAEAEHGLRRLSAAEREQLAFVLGLRPHEFTGAYTRAVAPTAAAPAGRRADQSAALLAVALAATLATSTLQATNPQLRLPTFPRPAVGLGWEPTASGALDSLPLPADVADLAAAVHAATIAELRARAAHEPEAFSPPLAAVPVDRPLPVVAAPPFELTAEGPRGCPVQAPAGRVVMTQGYGVGTHAPAAVWGAIDLAIDGNGDGYAEPGATWYAPVVATHAGHVRVTLNSYPAGNHVWVVDPASPWRTGYAHLAIITVASGQYVQPGEVIGLIGSTGMSSGPHLDYQVWRSEMNVDPTGLVGCR